MGILLDFFRWLRGCIASAVKWFLSLPGIITAALSSIVTMTVSLTSRFEWTTTIAGWIDGASAEIESMSTFPFGSIGQHVFCFFALDSFVEAAVSLFGVTVGLLTLIFGTLITVVFSCILGVIVIHSTMRLISISTAGLLKP